MSTIGPVLIGPATAPPSESGADPPDGRGSEFPALLAASQAEASEEVNGTGIPPDSESAEASGEALDHPVEATPQSGTETVTIDPLPGVEPEGEVVAAVAEPDESGDAAEGAEPAPTGAGGTVDGDGDPVDDGASVDDGAAPDGRNPQAAAGMPVAHGRGIEPGAIDGPPAFGREATPPGLAKKPDGDGSAVTPRNGAVATPPAYGRDADPRSIEGAPAFGRASGDAIAAATPAENAEAAPIDVAAVADQGDVPAVAEQGDVPAVAEQGDVPAAAEQGDVPAPVEQSDVPAAAQQQAAALGRALGRGFERDGVDGPPALGLRSVSARADNLPQANAFNATSGDDAGQTSPAPSGEAASSADVEAAELPSRASPTAQEAVAGRGRGGETAASRAAPQASPVATAVAAAASPVADPAAPAVNETAPQGGELAQARVDALLPRLAAADQVLNSIRLLRLSGREEIRVRLDPPELGTVVVRLVDRDGALSVHLRAEQMATADAIRAALPQLREALESVDLVVADMEAALGDAAFGAEQSGDGERGDEGGANGVNDADDGGDAASRASVSSAAFISDQHLVDIQA